MFTVYLAGPIPAGDEWRYDLIKMVRTRLSDRDDLVRFLIPHGGEHSKMLGEMTQAEGRPDVWSTADLISIRKSDLVVAFCTDTYKARGTGVECGYTLALNIPLAIWAPSEADQQAWSFLLTHTGAYEKLEEIADLIAYSADQLRGFHEP